MAKNSLCATDDAETQSQFSVKSTSRVLYEKLRFKTKDLEYYTDNTTVHGIKYLGERQRPKSEKIYWVLIFVVCFIGLGFFIADITDRWREKFLVLVEDDSPTPIYKIPFPAVTICPQAKIKSNQFSLNQLVEFIEWRNMNSSAFEHYYRKLEVAQQVCSTVQKIAETFDNGSYLSSYHIELLHEISPSLSDIIQRVEMPDSCEMKLSRLLNLNLKFTLQNETFSTILTNEGVCFTYNLPADILRTENLQTDYPYHNIPSHIKDWDYKNGYYTLDAFPKVSCSAGEVSSLRIELVSQLPHIQTICQSTTIGYKVILHSPAVYPTTYDSYIGINHETMTKIKVAPIKITTSESLRDYAPHERRCYFSDERHLRYYQFYNRKNCKLECFVNYTIEFQGCAHFAFPRADDIPICGARTNFLHFYEFVDSIDSVINYLNDYRDGNIDVDLDFDGSYNEFEFSSCDCLIECNSLEYEYAMVTETFKNENMHPDIRKVFNVSENSPTIIDIFWAEPTFVGRTRKRMYTLSDMVSNLGGLLGLFMGASVLSIFEVVYICIVRRINASDVEHQQMKD